jgi:hypothetical protein
MPTCSAIFYTVLPTIHAAGAITAMVLAFTCDTGKAKQVARKPYLLDHLPQGLSSRAGFYAAFPWDEGGEFHNYEWNPFALIFVFEWLTAAFALRPLMYYTEKLPWLFRLWEGWLAVGLALYIAWSATNSGGICVAMFITVLVSFLICAVVGYASIAPKILGYSVNLLVQQAPPSAPPPPEKLKTKVVQQFPDAWGRVWSIPSSIAGLRRRVWDDYARLAGSEGEHAEQQKSEYTYGVIIRYIEYCVTAPLLFLAVLCLMVPDAPAWLFITGYWLILVCNALGIALHASFSVPTEPSPDAGCLRIVAVLFPSPW